MPCKLWRWIHRRKIQGIKFHIDPKEYHEIWKAKTHCDFCNKKFGGHERKCVEHQHASGHIRGICCHTCNMNLSKIDRQRKDVLLELHRFWFRL